MPRKRASATAGGATPSSTTGAQGGIRSSRRSAGGGGRASLGDDGAAAAEPAMMNVWGDFMSEEMGGDDGGGGGAPSPAAGAATTATGSAPSADPATPAAADGPPGARRRYVLPIRPRMKHAETGRAADDDDDDGAPAPGLLAQTGTLDATEPGRSSSSSGGDAKPKGALFAKKTDYAPHELYCPTLLCPTSIFAGTKVAFIAAAPTSCHSVAITEGGLAYGWGRNETGQLGQGYSSRCVALPVLLTVGDDDVRFVGAAVGKYHTVLVGSQGQAYASGGNLCGQLGINNAGAREISKFRKCVVEDWRDEQADDGCLKIVQASCGESISALLSSDGHLYTAGSAEFGQLGNGTTGEHIVKAGKIEYDNSTKFIRRSVFCQSESDAAGGVATNMMTGKGVDSTGKVRCLTLEDSGQICLSHVSCGKHHTVAVEAPSTVDGSSATPRVFTWGSGDYGRLGHGIQADEYTPRLVAGLRGPIFANNSPVSAVAGSNCTLIKTKNGHVYYVGRHRSVGEATMRPTLVNELANNGHVVTAISAGSQTVFCSTKSGVTVSWGVGNHGELGYGKGENKSSSKPRFVNELDSCLVTNVACGMGHTLFVVRNEDKEDAKALKKVSKVEETDLSDFVDQMKAKEGDSDEKLGESAKKKQKGKGKK